MPTLYVQTERTPFFDDHEGYPSQFKDPDSVDSIVIDWSRILGVDTIATSSWRTEGSIELSGQANTTTQTSATVSGTGGDLTNYITTAGGKTYYKTTRYYRRQA